MRTFDMKDSMVFELRVNSINKKKFGNNIAMNRKNSSSEKMS